MAKPYSYTANTEAAAELYDSSLFKGLFKQRNTLLLDKTFPRAEKGLALPELSQKIGAATYSFKLTGDADKVSVKTKDSEWTAEYKKDAKNFDLTMKSKMMEGMSGMVKYEARGGAVTYTLGGACTVKPPVVGDIDLDFEASPFSKSVIMSALWVSPFVAGLTIAGDCSMAKMDPSSLMFNAGALWKGPLGSVNASFSNKTSFATVSLFNDALPVKGLSVAGEYTMAVPGMKAGTPKCPLSMGLGYKIDPEHTVKARVNSDMGAQVMLEKELAKGSSILIGTAMNLKDPMAVMPWNASFGIKLVCK